MSKHPWLENKSWAVVGASTHHESYGYKITERLLHHEYDVVPITPKYNQVLGKQAYPSLLSYEGNVDVVDFVVNPEIGIKILDDVIALGIKKILLQPGTVSAEILKKAKDHGIEVLESCVLVLLAWR